MTPPARRYQQKSGGFGGWKIVLLVLAVVAGSFGYAMYQHHESAGQTWRRFVEYLEQSTKPHTAAAPTPAPKATSLPPATTTQTPPVTPASPAPVQVAVAPKTDALAWLLEHPERRPKEVTLKKAVEFPVVVGGRVSGSAKIPAGNVIAVVALDRKVVTATYRGGGSRVPVEDTDLVQRAEAERAKGNPASAPASQASLRPSTLTTMPRPVRGAEDPMRFGAISTAEGTTFRLFSPAAKAVNVVLYDEATGSNGRQALPLQQKAKGNWEATVGGDWRGKFYTYQLEGNELDPSREVLDPYAVNTVADSSRGRLTELPPPVSKGPRVESPTDMVIYEMHVRDFTIAANSGVKSRGLYLGFTEPKTRLEGDEEIRTALDHLVELGVTHVQLMPTHDFENNESSRSYNWGYMTNAFFSPEGMFATNPTDDSRTRELKALIDALHARGIGVIMDVVFNHTAGGAALRFIAPQTYYRRLPDGSFANGSGCGNEFRSEDPIGRKLILDSLKFWVQRYGVDGFRFDLMALLDQQTMQEAERELRAINPDIVLYGEPWAAGDTPLRDKTDKGALRKVPVGAFNDDFRNALKGSPDGNDGGWIQNGANRDALKAALQGSEWTPTPGQSINYLTCHDNLVLWDKLKNTMAGRSDAQLKETMKLGYLALFTAEGVPFLHGGEEFARSKGGNKNSYDAPDSVNQVDWSLKRKNLDLFQYTRDLIALRKAHPVFRMRSHKEVAERLQFEETPSDKTLVFTLKGSGVPKETWRRVCVVMNCSDDGEVEVALPGGAWHVAFDEHGPAGDRTMSNKVTVRWKSGLILYQR